MQRGILLHHHQRKKKKGGGKDGEGSASPGVHHRTGLHTHELLIGEQDRHWSSKMYIFIFILALLFGGFWSLLPQEVKEQTTLSASQPAEKRPYGTYTVIGEVPVVKWTGEDKDLLPHLAKKHKPVVLRNTFVTKWDAFTKWNPQYLSDKLGKLNDVYVQKERIFGPYYDDTRPMATLKTVNRNPDAYHLANMTAKQFWHRTLTRKDNKDNRDNNNKDNTLGSKKEKPFVYYSTNIQNQASLITDLWPLEPLMFDSGEEQNINVWFGGNGVAAHTHYDSYHNLYVQVYGTKKWLLFPPAEALNLYVYPFLHPSHAQLQPNVHDSAEVPRFPNIRNAKAIEVTLQPGDLFYLPPMWFHYVEAGDVSISVNSWSYSDQSEIMQEVYSLELPFDAAEFGDGKFRSGAVGVYLRMLARKTHQNDQFFHNLYLTRFEQLMEDKILPTLHPYCDAQYGYDDIPDLPRRIMNKYMDAVYAAAALLQRIPADTREIWTMNYVEYVIAVTDGVENVGAFLKYCMPYEPLPTN